MTGKLLPQATPDGATTAVSDVTMCRYADTEYPEPGEYVPQQIHVMPAGGCPLAGLGSATQTNALTDRFVRNTPCVDLTSTTQARVTS